MTEKQAARHAGALEARKGIQYRHGITSQVYENLEYFQAGKCWICQLPKGKYRLRIDHDPGQGWIRGLLCKTCWTFLQRIDHGPENAMRAVTYLRQPPALDYLGRVGNQPKTRIAQTRRPAQHVEIVEQISPGGGRRVVLAGPTGKGSLPTSFRVISGG